MDLSDVSKLKLESWLCFMSCWPRVEVGCPDRALIPGPVLKLKEKISVQHERKKTRDQEA